MADQHTGDTPQCDYCDREELAYQLETDRGVVKRCIPCLMIERGQQQLSMPFEVFLDRDDIEPIDDPDAPDFEPFDPREHSYEMARGCFRVLARIVQDDPIIKRDPDAIGTVHGDLREFLTNIMGADAHRPPSEVAGADVDVTQATFGEVDDG